MLIVDGQKNITITKGDSFELSLIPYADDEHTSVYMLSEGERFVLSIRLEADDVPVIEKVATSQAEDGSFGYSFSASETKMLLAVPYIYDIAVISADGEEKNTFIGGEEVKKTFKVV